MGVEEQQRSRTAEAEASSGLAVLADLGVLRFDGPDVLGFLQGYLTTDTAELGGGPRFTAMCNIKGRTVCTGYAWLDGQAAVLVLHRSLCPVVLDFLRPYLAFSKTSASEMPLRVVGALRWAPSGSAPGPLPGGRLDDHRLLLLLDDAGSSDLLRREPAIERNGWDRDLITRREVWLQAETSGRFLPQMLGLDDLGAVSFSKGCYLGQEVVARAQYRGAVKRELATLNWRGAAPSPGTAIEANGREAGTVMAAAACGEPSAAAGGTGQALAVLVRDQSGPFRSPDSATDFSLAD